MAKQTADLTVPAPLFQTGAFPMICAKTGAPAQERKSITATYTNPLAAIGIIGGVLGVVILAAILRKQVAGSVPLSPKTGPTNTQKYGYWTLGAGAVAFGSMFVLPSSAVGWAFLAFAFLGIVGLGMVMVDSQRISAALSSDQQTVTLKKVDPVFADVVGQMMANAPMYAPAYAATPPMAPMPYQTSPQMPVYGSTGVPAPMAAPVVPAPGAPLPAVAAAPAPAPEFVDPFRS